jgi:hypothetical protein
MFLLLELACCRRNSSNVFWYGGKGLESPRMVYVYMGYHQKGLCKGYVLEIDIPFWDNIYIYAPYPKN